MTARGNLTLRPDGSAEWASSNQGRVALATVVLPDDSSFTTDVSDPYTVLAWSVPDAPEASRSSDLDAVFGGQPTWAQAKSQLSATAPSELDAPDRLADGWARVAQVAGVRRWLPCPIDPVLLVIDEGLAWFDVGQRDSAAREFLKVSNTLLDLGQRALDGELPRAALDIVVVAIRAAAAVIPDDASDRDDIRALDAQLAGTDILARVFSVEEWRHATAAFASVTTTPPLFAMAESMESPDLSGDAEFIAPDAVPPRALEWRPGERLVSVIADRAEGLLHVSVNLAQGTRAEDHEAQSLLAYAAVRETSQPWSSGALTANESGRVLSATLPLYDADPDTLTVIVYKAGHLDGVRMDQTGRELSKASRFLIDAWATWRMAEAARAGTAEADDDTITQARYTAVAQAERASDTLHRLISGPIGDDDRAKAEATFDAANELLDKVSQPAGPNDPATRPLLAELDVEADDPDAA